jgi:UDP-N-acetylmuramate--alanine ligase
MTNPNKKLLAKENLMQELEGREFEVLMTLGAGDIDVFRNPIKELFGE